MPAPYTDLVNWRLAALLLCVAGAAQATSDVYRYYVPHSGAVTKVAWSSPGAGWDVTVGFDSERCEIYCAYRRVHDAFGPTALAHFLLPPMTVLRLYRDAGSKPETVVVDPAGLRFPRATVRDPMRLERTGIPGRGLAAVAGPVNSGPAPAVPPGTSSIVNQTPPASLVTAPLRV